MNSKNVLWIDFAVAVPTFLLAAYMGANIAIAFSCGAIVASAVNLIGYSLMRR